MVAVLALDTKIATPIPQTTLIRTAQDSDAGLLGILFRVLHRWTPVLQYIRLIYAKLLPSPADEAQVVELYA